MTDTSRNVSTSIPGQATRQAPPEPTGWVGWVIFGATMMLMLGAFHVIEGFVALFKDQYFVVGKSGLVVTMDYTAWGWTHIVLGAVVVLAGLGLFAGQMWARWVGVIVALISAVANVAFLAAYPVWNSLMIGLDVIVIWAITVHGREMKSLR